MTLFRTALAFVAFAYAGDAVAQTSNCTSIGGGMVHCDNMGSNGTMSSTNCTNVGGGTATCNTTGNNQPNPTSDMRRPQTNGTTLNFVGGLISRSRERSFEKKLSQMVADGDCKGAANFAYLNRRNDLGDQIRRSCQQNESSNAPSAAFNLLCRGTETSFSKTGDMKEVAYSNVFRIHLGSLRYCDGDCAVTRSIETVEPARISFYFNVGSAGFGSELSVNRENGELGGSSVSVDHSMKFVTARCEKLPFTGFPQTKF